MTEREYRYWTEWSEEDGEWVGLCDGFPLVSWLGPGREGAGGGVGVCEGLRLVGWLERDGGAAEAGIRAVIAEAVEHLRAEGKPLPQPGVEWPPRSSTSRHRAPATGSQLA